MKIYLDPKYAYLKERRKKIIKQRNYEWTDEKIKYLEFIVKENIFLSLDAIAKKMNEQFPNGKQADRRMITNVLSIHIYHKPITTNIKITTPDGKTLTAQKTTKMNRSRIKRIVEWKNMHQSIKKLLELKGKNRVRDGNDLIERLIDEFPEYEKKMDLKRLNAYLKRMFPWARKRLRCQFRTEERHRIFWEKLVLENPNISIDEFLAATIEEFNNKKDPKEQKHPSRDAMRRRLRQIKDNLFKSESQSEPQSELPNSKDIKEKIRLLPPKPKQLKQRTKQKSRRRTAEGR